MNLPGTTINLPGQSVDSPRLGGTTHLGHKAKQLTYRVELLMYEAKPMLQKTIHNRWKRLL